jgi:hypothetical protein
MNTGAGTTGDTLESSSSEGSYNRLSCEVLVAGSFTSKLGIGVSGAMDGSYSLPPLESSLLPPCRRIPWAVTGFDVTG